MTFASARLHSASGPLLHQPEEVGGIRNDDWVTSRGLPQPRWAARYARTAHALLAAQPPFLSFSG